MKNRVAKVLTASKDALLPPMESMGYTLKRVWLVNSVAIGAILLAAIFSL